MQGAAATMVASSGVRFGRQIAFFRYHMHGPDVPLSDASSFEIALCTDGRICFYGRLHRWTRWHGSWELNRETIYMRFHFDGDEGKLKLCVCTLQTHALLEMQFLGMDYKGRRITMEFQRVYNETPGVEPWGTDARTNALIGWMRFAQPPTPLANMQTLTTIADAEVAQGEREDVASAIAETSSEREYVLIEV